MGRQRQLPENSTVFGIRLKKHEADVIKQAAEQAGFSLSEFVRVMSVAAAVRATAVRAEGGEA
jgi:uncharacterized protein (DUF1778 family)